MIDNINKKQLIFNFLMSLLAIVISIIIGSIIPTLWVLVYTVLLISPIVIGTKYIFNLLFIKIVNRNFENKTRKSVILSMTFFYIFQNILYMIPLLLVVLISVFVTNVVVFNIYMAIAWYISWTFVNLGISYFYKEKGMDVNG